MAQNKIYFGRGRQIIGPYHPDHVPMVGDQGWQDRFDALHVEAGEPEHEQIYRIEAPDMETAQARLRHEQEKDNKKVKA